MLRNLRKVPNRYSLARPEHMFLLALGSAIGIGNLLVLPPLMARYGVSSVFLTHLFLLFFVALPLVLSEMLWSRWLQRSLGQSFELVPRIGKLIWGIIILLWIDLTPSYLVEYSRILLSLFRFHWQQPVEMYLGQIHNDSVGEALTIYLVAACAIVVGTFVVSMTKLRLILLYRWGLGFVGLALLLLLGVLLANVDVSFVASRIQILDFSRFGVDPLMEILTYSLFSMSVGIGIYFAYVFYGSQASSNHETASRFWQRPGNLFRMIFRVFAVDLLFSILALFLLMPHLNSNGNYVAVSEEILSPEYFAVFLFPRYLASIVDVGVIATVAYYVIILVAGFFSLVSLIDVAFWTFDFELKLSRLRKQLLLVFLLVLLLAAPLLPLIRELVSDFGSGVLLPISALCWSLAAGWVIPRKVQSMLFGRGPRLDGLFTLWRFSVRWLLPAIFLSLFILRSLKRVGM